jgi:hypothetical protein
MRLGRAAAIEQSVHKVPGSRDMVAWVRQMKPNVVRIGDDFVGLIMPVKASSGTVWEPPRWIGT